MSKVPVVLPDGRRFESIVAAARAVGLHQTTLSKHLQIHGDLHRMGLGRGAKLPGFSGTLGKKFRKPFRFGGRTWPSRLAASRDLGVPYWRFKRAFRKNVPPDFAATMQTRLREAIVSAIMVRVAKADEARRRERLTE